MENMPDRPMSERRFSVFTLEDAGPAPPPVLGTFMMHDLSMKKKLLAGSEKQNARQLCFLAMRLFSNSANSSRGSPWPHVAEMNQPKEATTLGKSIGISAPNWATEDSAQSLDQVTDELQLEAHDQSITPKPYRDPTAAEYGKRNEAVASRAERMSLSPKDALEKKNEDELDPQ